MVRQKLDQLGVALPKFVAPIGSYVPVRTVGKLIVLSGQLPMLDGKLLAVGPVPSAVSIETAHVGARQCVINALAAVDTFVPGGVDSIASVVRLGVFVLSDAGFEGQPKVGNGASDFLLELFADAGRHARSAVGVNALPLGASVEIDFLFEMK
jgi:enamine deaminase RidA (YjgF/YER057c/UK114 family)